MSRLDPRMRTVVERYFETELDARLLLQLLPVKLKGGEWLFHQGDPGDSLYLVVRGRLQVWLGAEGTREADHLQLLGEMSAGDSVGEVGLISGEPRAAGIRAIRDSLLVRIDQESFGRLAEAHPSLGLKLAANVASMLQKTLGGNDDRARAFRTIALLPLNDSVEARALCREISHRMAATADAQVLAPGLLEQYGAPLDGQITDGELPADLRAWLSDLEYDHPVVLFSCEHEDSAWTRFSLRQSDLIVLVADAADDPQPSELERDLLMGSSPPAGNRALVLMHGVGREIRGTRHWLQARKVDFHLHYRAGDMRKEHPDSLAGVVLETQPGPGDPQPAPVRESEPLPEVGAYAPGDLNRIVRVISGKATGLVLSAGAVRGLAQLGVYKAIREAGIHIDWVGGTSIGSVVAATVAMGWGPDEAITRARKAFMEGKPFSDLTVPVMSLLRGERLRDLLEQHLAGDIEDLPLPFFCVSSNLDRGVLNVHEQGRLVEAIRASTALPGLLPPQVVGNELAVDGSVLNNLPVDVMQTRPVQTVIAVDVSSLSARTVDYDRTPSPWQVLWDRLLPWGARLRVPSLATVMLKATEIGTLLHSRQRAAQADLLLRPPVRDYGLTDVKAFDKVVAAGYAHASGELAAWLAARRVARGGENEA